MRFIERPFCDRLGIPFEQDLGPGLLSPQAVADPPVYQRARAVVRFEDGPARKLVHRLKYSDRAELAAPMGAWMARAGQEILSEADVVAPVPLHVRRLWTRRFNQAAMLAREIARQARQTLRAGAAGARQGDAQSGRPQPRAARPERARRVSRAPGRRSEGAPRRAGRRRPDLRRHRERRGARAAAGGRRAGRFHRFRAGCHNARDIPYCGVSHSQNLAGAAWCPPSSSTRSRSCPYCHAAKDLLRQKGAAFEEISVDGDRAGQAAMAAKAGGRSTVPQIFIGAAHVGGCDDLYDLEDAGRLDALLAG